MKIKESNLEEEEDSDYDKKGAYIYIYIYIGYESLGSDEVYEQIKSTNVATTNKRKKHTSRGQQPRPIIINDSDSETNGGINK